MEKFDIIETDVCRHLWGKQVACALEIEVCNAGQDPTRACGDDDRILAVGHILDFTCEMSAPMKGLANLHNVNT